MLTENKINNAQIMIGSDNGSLRLQAVGISFKSRVFSFSQGHLHKEQDVSVNGELAGTTAHVVVSWKCLSCKTYFELNCASLKIK